MAGRASRRRCPDRPSTKSSLLILHFRVDVKRLAEKGKDFPWPRPDRCPRCQGKRLWGHGYVRRYFEGLSEGIWLKRLRCPDCRAVHTLRPWGYYRGFIYSIRTIVSALCHRLRWGRSLGSVSRQAQQYWWRGFLMQASRRLNREPDVLLLRELFREGVIPVSHSLQCEILRL
jgi:hypothetical protein